MKVTQGEIYITENGMKFTNPYDCLAAELYQETHHLMISCGYMEDADRVKLSRLFCTYGEQVHKALGKYLAKRDELNSHTELNAPPVKQQTEKQKV